MFVNPDQYPRIDTLLEQIRDVPVRERVVFRAADGTPVPACVDANRLLQPEGTIICLVVSKLTGLESTTDIARRLQQEIAERERSEHAERASEERFRPVIPDDS